MPSPAAGPSPSVAAAGAACVAVVVLSARRRRLCHYDAPDDDRLALIQHQTGATGDDGARALCPHLESGGGIVALNSRRAECEPTIVLTRCQLSVFGHR